MSHEKTEQIFDIRLKKITSHVQKNNIILVHATGIYLQYTGHIVLSAAFDLKII